MFQLSILVSWIDSILKAIKQPKKIIVAIFIVMSALLFLPETLLKQLHLNEFIEKYGLYIGIIFIFSIALLLIELIIFSWSKWKLNKVKDEKKKIILSKLNNLDPIEQAVLREFYINNQNTKKLPLDNPVVAGLLSKGILFQVGRFGEQTLVGMLSSMKISEKAKKYIDIETHLELPNREPTHSEIDFINNSRPDFIIKIEREESRFNLY